MTKWIVLAATDTTCDGATFIEPLPLLPFDKGGICGSEYIQRHDFITNKVSIIVSYSEEPFRASIM